MTENELAIPEERRGQKRSVFACTRLWIEDSLPANSDSVITDLSRVVLVTKLPFWPFMEDR